MQINKEYERETSLRDLFFHILYRWRSILAAALIGAILLGGYAWVGNRRKVVQTVETVAVQTMENTDEADTLQKNYQASIQLYQNLLENNRKYRDNSVVMKLDPYHVWKAVTVYAVETENTETDAEAGSDAKARIAAVYPAMILSGFDAAELAAIYGVTEESYIGEVVTSTPLSGSYGSFSVTALGRTKDEVEKAIASLDKTVRDVSQGGIQQIAKHRTVQLSRFVRQTMDTDISSRQTAVAQNISVYQAAITSNENAISKAPVEAEMNGKPVKKSAVRYAATGFALGMIILICLYSVLYLLGRKLRDARELTDRFGIPVFGELNHSRARRSGKGIDKLIEKWEFYKTKMDPDIVLDDVCALIQEQRGNRHVLLTGTITADRMDWFAGSLKERLTGDADIIVEGDFLHNVRKITGADKTATVIIVEEKYQSETEDIRRMLETISLGKTTVSGAIVI